jgi:hypothetical protein
MTASRSLPSGPSMADVAGAASVLYAPALAEVIGYELIPDKPRVRGGILVTFRDERGALVTIRLLHKALSNLFRALAAGGTVQTSGAESGRTCEATPLLNQKGSFHQVGPMSRSAPIWLRKVA